MRQTLSNVADVRQKIEAGRKLLLAGDEDVLRQLPKGDWIGGTIPYFISSEQGGMVSRELIFATDITDIAPSFEISTYDQDSLARVYSEGPKHGFSFILLPAASKTHMSFALNGPNYKDFGVRPLIGWVAGVHLSDLGKKTPKVMNGRTGEEHGHKYPRHSTSASIRHLSGFYRGRQCLSLSNPIRERSGANHRKPGAQNS